jgi:hypothetical protein
MNDLGMTKDESELIPLKRVRRGDSVAGAERALQLRSAIPLPRVPLLGVLGQRACHEFAEVVLQLGV